MEKEDNMRNVTSPPRRLRDVADVEGYVRDAVDQVAPAGTGVREALHAHGVRAVLRSNARCRPGFPCCRCSTRCCRPGSPLCDQRMCSDDPLAAVA